MKKMTVIMIAFSLALLIALSACQKMPATNDPTQITTAPTEQQPAQTQPTESVSTEPQKPLETQPTEPADPWITEMQKLLEHRGPESFYNSALLSVYDDPADVNLLRLFYDGYRSESQKPTEAEFVLLEGKMGEHWKEMDLFRLPVEKMDATLTALFGITLKETNGVGLEYLTYLEETNCYYTAHTGPDCAEVSVQNVVVQDDGIVRVYYDTGYDLSDHMVLTLKYEGKGYQIVSNQIDTPAA